MYIYRMYSKINFLSFIFTYSNHICTVHDTNCTDTFPLYGDTNCVYFHNTISPSQQKYNHVFISIYLILLKDY